MRIIFAGTPEFAVPGLTALIGAGHDLAAVYTQPDRPAGRGRLLQASPVKQLAMAHGIAVRQPESLKRDPIRRVADRLERASNSRSRSMGWSLKIQRMASWTRWVSRAPLISALVRGDRSCRV